MEKHLQMLSLLIVLSLSLLGCSEPIEPKAAVINNTIIQNVSTVLDSTVYEPSQLLYESILKLKGVKYGKIVFDTDNLALKFYDGTKWDYLSNIKWSTTKKKNLANLQIAPDSLTQIGFYNDNWYVARSFKVEPYWQKVLFSEQQVVAIQRGNELENNTITVSKYEKETYAHGSRLLISGGKAYIVYYGNEQSILEGTGSQLTRLTVVDILNTANKEYYDIIVPNTTYKTLKTDNAPCYAPIVFMTSDGKIRIFVRVTIGGIQKYIYRDFDPVSKSLSDPIVGMIQINNQNSSVEFSYNNLLTHLQNNLGNFVQSYKNMFVESEPIIINGVVYIGVTLGAYYSDWTKDEGTTLLLKSTDYGKTFTCLGAPNPSGIDAKFCKQFAEGSFDFTGTNELTMLGRNDVGGMFLTTSKDGGKTFSDPYSLNDKYGYNTRGTKPYYKQVNGGHYISIWNLTESVGNLDVGYADRTVMDIRYGTNKLIGGNDIKIRLKTLTGCHYPSIYQYGGNYYMTYTRDVRRVGSNSTGDIGFVKINFQELVN